MSRRFPTPALTGAGPRVCSQPALQRTPLAIILDCIGYGGLVKRTRHRGSHSLPGANGPGQTPVVPVAVAAHNTPEALPRISWKRRHVFHVQEACLWSA